MFVAVTLSFAMFLVCIGLLGARHVWYSMHDLSELSRLRPQKFAGLRRDHAVILGRQLDRDARRCRVGTLLPTHHRYRAR